MSSDYTDAELLRIYDENRQRVFEAMKRVAKPKDPRDINNEGGM
jgi:hypothetical protein